MTKPKPKPFNPDDPFPAKLLRKLKREAKRENPALWRAMRRMTNEQLRELEVEIREDELRRLRRMRQNDPTVQYEIGKHLYALRNLDELKFWQNYKPPRKQIPRYKPAPVKEAPTQPTQSFWPAELLSDLALAPKPKQAEPELPDNFHGKFFHSSNDDYSVW